MNIFLNIKNYYMKSNSINDYNNNYTNNYMNNKYNKIFKKNMIVN
jgi:hypothetical protein